MNNYTFEKALEEMPDCLMGYDPFQQKTIDDLIWMGQHEIDLYEEGEETDIENKRQLGQVRKWMSKMRGTKAIRFNQVTT